MDIELLCHCTFHGLYFDVVLFGMCKFVFDHVHIFYFCIHSYLAYIYFVHFTNRYKDAQINLVRIIHATYIVNIGLNTVLWML